jgi:DNA-binding response OmpR family regulator
MDKILIVDDDPIALQIIANGLESNKNYSVIKASDAYCALKILDDNQDIKLLIVDYQMPGPNGLETAQLAVSKYPVTLPVIMVSGAVSLKDIGSVLKNGVDYFLPKPINLKELRDYVSRCINGIDNIEASH